MGALELDEGHIAKAMAACELALAELERWHGIRNAACAGFRRALAIHERIQIPRVESARQRLRALGCEP